MAKLSAVPMTRAAPPAALGPFAIRGAECDVKRQQHSKESVAASASQRDPGTARRGVRW